PGGANGLEGPLRIIRIDRVWRKALQPKDNGPIRSMADACKGERAVEADRNMGDFNARWPWPVPIPDFAQKPMCRDHRAHRMGTRRTNADLEQFEDGKEHLLS